MSEHADFEALSAYVDGEAPEWAGHVAACATCRASAAELQAVAGAVGAPVRPPPAAERDRSIAAALVGFGEPTAPPVPPHPRFSRRRFENRWALGAVAAAVVAALGLSGLVLSGGRSADDATTVAGPALESAPQADAFTAGGQKDTSAAGAAVPQTDLGDVPDAATLLARARPAVTSGQARSSANSGAGGSATAAAPAPEQRAAAPPSLVPSSRPCEEQVRAREPSLREVVFFATARRGPTPAVVLGFATGPPPAPVTLLLLAQEGCSELVRASAAP